MRMKSNIKTRWLFPKHKMSLKLSWNRMKNSEKAHFTIVWFWTEQTLNALVYDGNENRICLCCISTETLQNPFHFYKSFHCDEKIFHFQNFFQDNQHSNSVEWQQNEIVFFYFFRLRRSSFRFYLIQRNDGNTFLLSKLSTLILMNRATLFHLKKHKQKI